MKRSVSMRGACYVCHGTEPHWQAKNTVGVAAKHNQTTGHETWVDIEISVTYPARKAKNKPTASDKEQ